MIFSAFVVHLFFGHREETGSAEPQSLKTQQILTTTIIENPHSMDFYAVHQSNPAARSMYPIDVVMVIDGRWRDLSSMDSCRAANPGH